MEAVGKIPPKSDCASVGETPASVACAPADENFRKSFFFVGKVTTVLAAGGF